MNLEDFMSNTMNSYLGYIPGLVGERGEDRPVNVDVYEPNGWVLSEKQTKVTFLS